ncbi:MAG: hypothetical protein CL605_08650 [Altibacter sp.]|uniref:hypothetical protein n=1 Tax=Altibacter sp. TaxID=2024823 RepID=UPI000C899816|nr:hypothetical protein [Altibacter sp.]MAP54955.1 hypothetical protein [Altibacter sp.]|tara:strand:- start:90 stop:560 length:471 start_codon:yes stop_codon:yes gene_type:complete
MKRINIWFYIFLIVTISSIILLVTGSPLLTLPLDEFHTIPLGTFITWLGMISLPLTIFIGCREFRNPTTKLNRILSGFLKIIIVLGILWVPISYLLAGNLSFNFSEKDTFQGGQTAMIWFWRLSYGIGIGSISILIIYLISLIFKKNKTGANKELR